LALKHCRTKPKTNTSKSFIIIFFCWTDFSCTDFILTSLFPEINFFLENSSSECLSYYNYSFNNSSVSSFSCMSLRKIVREYLFPGKDYLGRTDIIKNQVRKNFLPSCRRKLSLLYHSIKKLSFD
jgi:hypothetical protein